MTTTEFEQITHRLRPKMMRVAMDYFHNADDAEDAVQEVLLKLWMREWKPDDNIEALAIRGTKNMCVTIWRRQKVRTTLDLDVSHDSASGDSSDAKVIAADQAKILDDALSTLPRSEQRLMRMKLDSDLDTSQLSAITGIPVRSISTMVSSARKKLINLLNSYETDFDR